MAKKAKISAVKPSNEVHMLNDISNLKIQDVEFRNTLDKRVRKDGKKPYIGNWITFLDDNVDSLLNIAQLVRQQLNDTEFDLMELRENKDNPGTYDVVDFKPTKCGVVKGKLVIGG